MIYSLRYNVKEWVRFASIFFVPFSYLCNVSCKLSQQRIKTINYLELDIMDLQGYSSEITIHRGEGFSDVIVPITPNSVRVAKLMGDDYIQLVFNLTESVYFPIGSYCFINDKVLQSSYVAGKYIITAQQNPRREGNTYRYELRMDRYYVEWKNRLYKYSPLYGSREASWTLSARLEIFVQLFVENLKKNGYRFHSIVDGHDTYTDYTYQISTFATQEIDFEEAKAISFDSVSLYNALTTIAQTWKCEWWVDDNVIHFGRCELDMRDEDCVVLEEGRNLSSITSQGSQNTYATRIYCFGSDKNIPSWYRKKLEFTTGEKDKAIDYTRPMTPSFFKYSTLTFDDLNVEAVNFPSTILNLTYSLKEKWTDILNGQKGEQSEYSKGKVDGLLYDGKMRVSASGKGSATTDYYFPKVGNTRAQKGVYAVTIDNGHVMVNCTQKVNLFVSVSLYFRTQDDIDNNREGDLLLFDSYTLADGKTADLGISFDGLVSFDGNVGTGLYLMVDIDNLDETEHDLTIVTNNINVQFSDITVNTEINVLSGSRKGQKITATASPKGENMDKLVFDCVGLQSGDKYTLTNINKGKIKSSYYSKSYGNDVVQNGVVATRLMLPETSEYPYNNIDAEENLPDSEIIEAVVANDDIFPRQELLVDSITTKVKYDEEKLSNGEKVKTPWNAYQLRVAIDQTKFPNATFHFYKDYILKGKTLSCTFMSGKLNGMTFEVLFNPNARTEKSEDSQVFEIVRNEDYGRPIPDDVLYPQVGDKIVFFNFDTDLVGDQLLTMAEEELAIEMKKYMAKSKIDDRAFDVGVIACENPMEVLQRQLQGYSDAETLPLFQLGHRVRLNDAAFFKEGYRYSRVIGMECKLDFPFDAPKYTLGESSAYSTLRALSEQIESLKMNGASVTVSNGGGNFYVIKDHDSTAPSDSNVFSALRCKRQFLNAIEEDIAEGIITFAEGLKSMGLTEIFGNLSVKGDSNIQGNAHFGNYVDFAKTIRSKMFVNSMDYGRGWQLDENGNLQIESAEIRSSLKVLELVYNRLSAQEGDTVYTESGTIEKVVPLPNVGAYRCYLKKRSDTDFNAFRKGDVLRGVVNNLAELGGGQFFTCFYYITDYKAEIGADGENYIDVMAYGSERPVYMKDANDNIVYVKDINGNDIPQVSYFIAPPYLLKESFEGTVVNEEDYYLLNGEKVKNNMGVPSGKNYEPTELMMLNRWGNNVYPSEEAHNNNDYKTFIVAKNGKWINTRQSSWYISSYEKRITMLDGVDKPILDEDNYAAFFGLPFNLSNFKGHSMDASQPYLYCRGAFLQDVHYIDYKGQVIKLERNRGNWSAEVAGSSDPYVVTDTTYDTVFYKDAKWQCLASVASTKAPDASGNSEWSKVFEVGSVVNYTIIPSVSQVIRDAEGNPNVKIITCDVIKQVGESAPEYVTEEERQVYIGRNQEFPIPTPSRSVAVSADDETIEFYLYNPDSMLGNIEFGESMFAFLTGKVTVSIINEGNVLTVSSSVKYAVSQYGDEAHRPLANEFSKNMPIVNDGQFLWTWTHTEYSAGEPTDVYTVSRVGKSLGQTTIKYATSTTSERPNNSAFQLQMPQVEDGKYLWTWTHIEYSSGEPSDLYSVSRVGIDGDGIYDVQVDYYQDASGTLTTQQLEQKTWLEDCPTLIEDYWLYVRTSIIYDAGKNPVRSYTRTQNGKGSYYAGLEEYYAVGEDNVTPPSGYPTSVTFEKGVAKYPNGTQMTINKTIWKEGIKPTADEYSKKPYLWNFEISLDSSGNRYVTAPLCIGNNAKGILYILEAYAISANSEAGEGRQYPSDILDGDWTDEQANAAPNEGNPYQWNRTTVVYNTKTNDPTQNDKEVYYHISAVKGSDGADGAQPNLYGYGTELSNVFSVGSIVHTHKGFGAYANNTNSASGSNHCVVGVVMDMIVSKKYAVSFFIKPPKNCSVQVTLGDASETFTNILANTETEIAVKGMALRTTETIAIKLTPTNGTMIGLINVRDFKVEYAENTVGTHTVFNGLADDKIPQGQNLLGGSGLFGESWEKDSHTISNSEDFQGHTSLYCNPSSANLVIASQNISLKGGNWYTLSFWAKGSGGTLISKVVGKDTQDVIVLQNHTSLCVSDCEDDICRIKSIGAYPSVFHTLSSKWKRHTLTFYVPQNVNAKLQFIAYNASQYYYIAMPKMEVGDKATDWQLSENDRKGVGQRGIRGAVLRGPSLWNENTDYMGGADNEQYQDLVMRVVNGRTSYYLCRRSNRGKDPDNASYQTAEQIAPQGTYWQLSSVSDFVATKVLFAERGKIEDADMINVTIRGTITEDCENMISNILMVGEEQNRLSSINVDTSGNMFQYLSENDLLPPKVNKEVGHLGDNVIYDSNYYNYHGSIIPLVAPRNGIIQLPTYYGCNKNNEYPNMAFHANSYQIAGTRLSIFTSPDQNFPNWSGFNFSPKEDFSEELTDLISSSVLVCADPLSLMCNNENRSIHDWGGRILYWDDYAQGRFAYKGRTARFVLLFPGQHLDLISQIQYIKKSEQENIVPSLVWNICNSSDFEPIGLTFFCMNFNEPSFTFRRKPSVYNGVGNMGGEDALLGNLADYLDGNIRIGITLAEEGQEDYPSWEVL